MHKLAGGSGRMHPGRILNIYDSFLVAYETIILILIYMYK